MSEGCGDLYAAAFLIYSRLTMRYLYYSVMFASFFVFVYCNCSVNVL